MVEKELVKEKKATKKETPIKSELPLTEVVKHPLSTEKCVRLMESENKLLFVVDRRANKADVKKAVETLFKVKVVAVNILNTAKSQKRAYVKFSPETPAVDIATDLKLI